MPNLFLAFRKTLHQVLNFCGCFLIGNGLGDNFSHHCRSEKKWDIQNDTHQIPIDAIVAQAQSRLSLLKNARVAFNSEFECRRAVVCTREVTTGLIVLTLWFRHLDETVTISEVFGDTAIVVFNLRDITVKNFVIRILVIDNSINISAV